MMRHHHFSAALLISAGLVLGAGAASAQGFPEGLAPRCQATELQAGTAGRGPCDMLPAQFGLRGPTVIATRDVDIETTGSVSAPRESDQTRQSPAR